MSFNKALISALEGMATEWIAIGGNCAEPLGEIKDFITQLNKEEAMQVKLQDRVTCLPGTPISRQFFGVGVVVEISQLQNISGGWVVTVVDEDGRTHAEVPATCVEVVK